MHKSPPNPSEKTRTIYTFHMIEGGKGVVYDERNWYVNAADGAPPFPLSSDVTQD